jgi:polysaccharide biosynthesis protein PslG
VVVILALAAGAAPAQALPSRFYGVNSGTYSTSRDARLMKQDGVRIARFQINWAATQPHRHGPYNWSITDQQIAVLAKQRILAAPFFLGTPAWVGHAITTPPVRSAAGRRGWKRFVRAAVDRYGRGGAFWTAHPELPRLTVRSWQIWNEPNFPAYWSPKPSPKGYTRLLEMSARVIRAADPSAKVVLSGLGPGLALRSQVPSWKFLRGLYHHGAKPFFDVATEHPYAANSGGAIYQLKKVRSVMRHQGDGRTPLWVTEVGWSSGRVPHNHLAVGPKRQAKLLRRTFARIRSHRAALGIKHLLWFNWRDAQGTHDNCRNCFAFGLRHYNEQPKRVLRAYTRFAKR